MDDLVDALVKLMDSPTDFCGPVNLGNPVEFTMRELADRVISLCGSPSTIVFRPLPGDDPARRRPDIALAQEMLGWEPSVGLVEGLGRTIDYFRRLQGSGRKSQERSLHAQVK